MPVIKKAQKTKRPITTPDRILEVAERLMQTRGYNGFSYADVAAEIGISKASRHYHFATKAALGAALIERYAARVDAALESFDAGEVEATGRLARYAQLYADMLSQDRLCLCGMLAAEYSTLPQPMQKTIRQFFVKNHRWLTSVIARGRTAGSLFPRSTDESAALMLLGGLEGAMLIARPMKDIDGFYASARQLLALLQRPG